MKEFKGTKGNWYISNDSLNLETIVQTDRFRIAEVKHYDLKIDPILKEPSKSKGKANAKLIASAPDLLEALQKIASNSNDHAMIRIAIKAINKALE